MSNEQKEPESNKPKSQSTGYWIAVGLAIGAGIGVAIGAALSAAQAHRNNNK